VSQFLVIPNFSEGRDPAVVEAIAEALRSVPGVQLLDVEMDPKHHRSVLTAAGEGEALAEAAFRATAKAAELIDLTRHQGDHPRIGATDVIPFVPVGDAPMTEAVALARSLAERIARELGIPTYLYEEAAIRPDRRSLPAIRKGGFEVLREEVGRPERQPDFGPPALHPTAGATVVGARRPLVAFNVNLRTTDLEVAKAIARTVRESSGGLKNVRAIAVDLSDRGMVQVSMNLVDVDTTPIYLAYEFVEREAAQRGVAVAESEIVGLVGLDAMLAVAARHLRLAGFRSEQVVEKRLWGEGR
jgi:glutamate formiminotransferase